MRDGPYRQSEQIDLQVAKAFAMLIGAISGGAAGYTFVCAVLDPVSHPVGALHLIAGLAGVCVGAVFGHSQASTVLDTTT